MLCPLCVCILDNAYTLSVIACVKSLSLPRRQICFLTFLRSLKGTVWEKKMETQISVLVNNHCDSLRSWRGPRDASVTLCNSYALEFAVCLTMMSCSLWFVRCAIYNDVVPFGAHSWWRYVLKTFVFLGRCDSLWLVVTPCDSSELEFAVCFAMMSRSLWLVRRTTTIIL